MGNFDRQIANALSKLHRELFGGHMEAACRWHYNSKSDIYHCPHTAIFGKALMEHLPDWEEFNQGPATDHQEHNL